MHVVCHVSADAKHVVNPYHSLCEQASLSSRTVESSLRLEDHGMPRLAAYCVSVYCAGGDILCCACPDCHELLRAGYIR